MSYKTLIIVDNSSELTTLNRDIIKETVKYLIKNAPEDTEFAIALTGQNAEYKCEYDDSLSTKLKTAEEIYFPDINASVTDVLMDLVLSWKNNDFAMRDIIVISGSDITKDSEYTLEELFFETGTRDYPIYTLTCSQDNNEAYVKTIASISRISGGKSFDVSDAKEEADVEKQLGDMLLNALKENRTVNDEEQEESEKSIDSIEEEALEHAEDAAETETVENDLYSAENDIKNATSNMIYQIPDENVSLTKLIAPAVIFTIAAVLLFFYFRQKSKRDKREDDIYYKRVSVPDSKSIDMSGSLPFENIRHMENATLSLSDDDKDDEDTGTRILYQSREGVEITLEDRANPTKYFRLNVRDSVVIGRNPKCCDVVIDYDDSVSSKHCEFYLRGESVYLRDLNSSNGTMINQQKIYQEVKLESGDILRIGRLSFFVQIIGGMNG